MSKYFTALLFVIGAIIWSLAIEEKQSAYEDTISNLTWHVNFQEDHIDSLYSVVNILHTLLLEEGLTNKQIEQRLEELWKEK